MVMTVFDRRLVRQRRDRAARTFDRFDFLKQAAAERLVDRLGDVRRTFGRVVDLGAHTGGVVESLPPGVGSDFLLSTDISEAMLARRDGSYPGAVVDEEALPFADGSLDAVLSALSLHWVNDLPGALVQIRRALKPDGLFLGVMLGGETLVELRDVLTEAEVETTGGLSPHISPFADVADLGGLMQRAGFALPVVDTEKLTVTYDTLFDLFRDLRGMGETNALLERPKTPLRREVFIKAAERYAERFSGHDGRLPATFQFLWLTGWTPHESQPTALRPGSAQNRLSDALETEEWSTGERAPPNQ